ncbi:hypothetical protein PanWU01x14_266090 [Parasponia andersonii]|uniref:Uncharacterized protein n=1 Tax=Parasponia andersonii TaxID=3476 RepID=A0A2P5B706_PARAD|nr:hypothetical protein PanWU01x14_266090 [Parasponia andersonii]
MSMLKMMLRRAVFKGLGIKIIFKGKHYPAMTKKLLTRLRRSSEDSTLRRIVFYSSSAGRGMARGSGSALVAGGFYQVSTFKIVDVS